MTPLRAIYVGPPVDFLHGHPLRYGMTGLHIDFGGSIGPTFKPDGALGGKIVGRDEIYIPALDKTRHCPKP